jgi:hypothetical protein
MSDETTWQPEHLTGHQPYCADPGHALTAYCRADPADPPTMTGEPSRAWLAGHPDCTSGAFAGCLAELDFTADIIALCTRMRDPLSPAQLMLLGCTVNRIENAAAGLRSMMERKYRQAHERQPS